jgi:hypothetical protein
MTFQEWWMDQELEPYRYHEYEMTWRAAQKAQREKDKCLIIALKPSACDACGEGVTYLASDGEGLLFRVCDKCGSELVGQFEADYNVETCK